MFPAGQAAPIGETLAAGVGAWQQATYIGGVTLSSSCFLPYAIGRSVVGGRGIGDSFRPGARCPVGLGRHERNLGSGTRPDSISAGSAVFYNAGHNQEKAEAGCFPPGHRESVRGRSLEVRTPCVPWYRNLTICDESGSRGTVTGPRVAAGCCLFFSNEIPFRPVGRTSKETCNRRATRQR